MAYKQGVACGASVTLLLGSAALLGLYVACSSLACEALAYSYFSPVWTAGIVFATAFMGICMSATKSEDGCGWFFLCLSIMGILATLACVGTTLYAFVWELVSETSSVTYNPRPSYGATTTTTTTAATDTTTAAAVQRADPQVAPALWVCMACVAFVLSIVSCVTACQYCCCCQEPVVTERLVVVTQDQLVSPQTIFLENTTVVHQSQPQTIVLGTLQQQQHHQVFQPSVPGTWPGHGPVTAPGPAFQPPPLAFQPPPPYPAVVTPAAPCPPQPTPGASLPRQQQQQKRKQKQKQKQKKQKQQPQQQHHQQPQQQHHQQPQQQHHQQPQQQHHHQQQQQHQQPQQHQQQRPQQQQQARPPVQPSAPPAPAAQALPPSHPPPPPGPQPGPADPVIGDSSSTSSRPAPPSPPPNIYQPLIPEARQGAAAPAATQHTYEENLAHAYTYIDAGADRSNFEPLQRAPPAIEGSGSYIEPAADGGESYDYVQPPADEYDDTLVDPDPTVAAPAPAYYVNSAAGKRAKKPNKRKR